MKITNLISGSGILPIHDITDLMLRNALTEIEQLEDELRDRDREIDFYKEIMNRLKKLAICSYADYYKSDVITFRSVYKTDDEAFFYDLMELFQLEEPEEGNDDEMD